MTEQHDRRRGRPDGTPMHGFDQKFKLVRTAPHANDQDVAPERPGDSVEGDQDEFERESRRGDLNP